MTAPAQTPLDVVSAAVARRRATAPGFRLTAHRWVNGPGDGAPAGVSVDRYGDAAVLNVRAEVAPTVRAAYADAVKAVLEPPTLVEKVWAPRRADSSSRTLYGDAAAPVDVYEEDAIFRCLLDDGIQTGLFLDHRETRRRVRAFCGGAEVLNAFAYTCAFSVHAALAGASRVTSVDASRRALARGRENMTLSGLSPDEHRWFDDDVLDHLARGGPDYDVIVLDPPLYGRTKKKRFALLRDLDRLAEGAMRRLRPGGRLVFSTHALELDGPRLRRAVERAGAGRRVRVLESLGLPVWDHPVAPRDVDGDRGDYLHTLVLGVD